MTIKYKIKTTSAGFDFFHIDIAGHQKEEKVNKALVELKDCAAFFKILGSYPKAK